MPPSPRGSWCAGGNRLTSRTEVGREALDRALDDTDRLLPVYQPIHDARTGEVRAAEALLRQMRSNGEMREAAIIRETAEKKGGEDLAHLESHLIRLAAKDAAAWQADGFESVYLNVNISPRDLRTSIGRSLAAIVSRCGVDARRINLEITETSYIEKPEETMEVLEEIVDLGIRLWLDDFGTGFSSITHLQHFPLTGLKLPSAFVADLPSDRRCVSIVRSLIALAHDLDLEVIAEGVERQEQLDFLRQLDCDLIQGFLFNRPMELRDFEELLRSGAAG